MQTTPSPPRRGFASLDLRRFQIQYARLSVHFLSSCELPRPIRRSEVIARLYKPTAAVNLISAEVHLSHPMSRELDQYRHAMLYGYIDDRNSPMLGAHSSSSADDVHRELTLPSFSTIETGTYEPLFAPYTDPTMWEPAYTPWQAGGIDPQQVIEPSKLTWQAPSQCQLRSDYEHFEATLATSHARPSHWPVSPISYEEPTIYEPHQMIEPESRASSHAGSSYDEHAESIPVSPGPSIASRSISSVSTRDTFSTRDMAFLDSELDDKRATRFISIMWNLLSGGEHSKYLRWDAAGKSFLVNMQDARFVEAVLFKHFGHTNAASFCRQLNVYSFKRLSPFALLRALAGSEGGSDISDEVASTWCGFEHQSFTLDAKEQLCSIKPKVKSGRGGARGKANKPYRRTKVSSKRKVRMHSDDEDSEYSNA
ncbi:uncharacterized protein L969DRAFT_394224 [Mixia osmundae IAM 14324]|nr:uncharacterized protein L969DRAFT_394224 [Mixia osmundae IAM 14324]KEI39958.1 hypothetical protein L969DRAFT_394224 [Mixia osmundae IAM 14324]